MVRPFADLQAEMFSAANATRYEEALRLAREARRDHPGRAARADYWIACLQCLLERPDEALATLEATLAAGAWVSPERLRSDSDLAPIRDRPAFARIVAECERRRDLERPGVRPLLRVAAPEARSAAPPLLLGLHMAGSDAHEILTHWREGAGPGTLLAAAQGTVLTAPGAFSWGETAEADIAAHLDELTLDHAFDPHRLVLAGASQGAAVAVSLAASGRPRPSRGFVAVVGAPEPGGMGRLREDIADLRGVFITGEADFARDRVARAHHALRDRGADVRLEVVPGLAHSYPADFDARLRAALAFILG